MSAAVSLPPAPRALRPIAFTAFCDRVLRLRLTRGQRALAMVAFDGVDPIDLPDELRALALEIFGGVERIPPLVRQILIFVLRCGRWSGKSLLCAARGVYRMVTADLSQCGPGDEAAVLVISPRLKTSRIAKRAALALVKAAPALAPLVIAETSDEFKLRRPNDGRVVTFCCVPKSSGGNAARGYSLIEIIFDESEFLPVKAADAAVTDRDIIAAVIPRLLMPGAVLLASTPWPAESETATLFDANYGAPTRALAARAPTLLMRDHDPAIAAKIESERARDPKNARREYDCLSTDAEGCWFEAESVERAYVAAVTARRRLASAGIDLAFKNDSSAMVIVERQGELLVVVFVELLSPAPGKPLKPSRVVQGFARAAHEYGCTEFTADAHYIESAREHAQNVIVGERVGLGVVMGPSGPAEIEEAFLYVRDLHREDRVRYSDERLAKQLKSVLAVAQPGGRVKPVLPRRAGAGHTDLVSALVNAAWHDRRHGPLLRTVTNLADAPQAIAGPYASGDGWMVR